MDLLKLLQEGDATGLEMQKALEALDLAKSAVETAKERYDLTKNFFEQVIARAEEAGIARAKFKKLVEERVAGLWNSGLIAQADERVPRAVKAPKASKKVKVEVETGDDFTSASSDDALDVSEMAIAN